jgi:thiamine pyrophosphate-dependent acetolactate synthase large subunit-like protein
MQLSSPSRSRRTTTSCGEALAGLLEARGTEVVFGIPGVHTLEIYRGLSNSSIRHVTPRHEQGAAFMADGYARVTGRPGVCLLITGPGVTNAATAVASAYHDSQPLLVVSSATATRDARRGRGSLHDLPDQQAFMSTIAAFSETVTDPHELAPALDRAFAVLEGPRPRPVHIGVPIDVLSEAAVASRPASAAAPSPPRVADAELEHAASLLWQTHEPMILLGGGAIDGGEAALRVAQAIGAPIVTSVNGKGAVPEDHPASVGATTALQPVFGALEQADVVLAVGTELSEVDYYFNDGPPRFAGRLIRVDVDPVQLTSGREPYLALLGDARETLSSLAERLDGDRSSQAATRAAELRAGIELPAPERTLSVLDAIAAALPPGAVVAADSTQLAYIANWYLLAKRSRSYLCPAGFGTLGPALPMAIGAKLGAPDRAVACLVGDGGLLFTIAELATAAQLGLPIAVILWQNHGYGEIRDSMDRSGIPHIGTDTSARDYLAVARGLGCHALRARAADDVSAAVREALESDRPTLIEVPAELG